MDSEILAGTADYTVPGGRVGAALSWAARDGIWGMIAANRRPRRERAMMGRLSHDQEQFFYSFCLGEVVPDDHPVREIAAVLDLSWVHSELASYYSRLGGLGKSDFNSIGIDRHSAPQRHQRRFGFVRRPRTPRTSPTW
jgi:hypothetical protein